MDNNMVSKEYCTEHNRMMDERFSRDKEDIKRHNDAIGKLTTLSTEIGQLIKQHDDVIKQHETRIDTLEHKPSVWFDRIISGIVAAVVAALVAAVLKGNINF